MTQITIEQLQLTYLKYAVHSRQIEKIFSCNELQTIITTLLKRAIRNPGGASHHALNGIYQHDEDNIVLLNTAKNIVFNDPVMANEKKRFWFSKPLSLIDEFFLHFETQIVNDNLLNFLRGNDNKTSPIIRR